MIQYIVELGKFGLYFAAVTVLQFILFFVFAKYRTGQTFKELLVKFSNMFAQALFFATSLLFAIVILVKGFSVATFTIIMLSISSMAIMMKYIGLIKEYRIIVFDGTVLLLNMFDIYFLMTDAPVVTKHFFIFYVVVLYLFLYQHVRKLYLYESVS